MKKTPATKSEFSCEFCNRAFRREETIFRHLCESKRRWQDKDLPGNRIGFQSWVRFYAKNTATKKPKTYLDFTKSAYYLAFVRFGHYCVNIKCLNVNRYADWLLKNDIKIDNWTSDNSYTKFIIDHLKTEDPLDAIARSIETTIELAKDERIQSKDYLRYGNRNKICHQITTGRISPWMLYHTESGITMVESLDETQQKMILEYINPEQWAIKFRRGSDIVVQVKELLAAAGY
jgi:hypothetical protein